jgi:hypothetical protein
MAGTARKTTAAPSSSPNPADALRAGATGARGVSMMAPARRPAVLRDSNSQQASVLGRARHGPAMTHGRQL